MSEYCNWKQIPYYLLKTSPYISMLTKFKVWKWCSFQNQNNYLVLPHMFLWYNPESKFLHCFTVCIVGESTILCNTNLYNQDHTSINKLYCPKKQYNNLYLAKVKKSHNLHDYSFIWICHQKSFYLLYCKANQMKLK